MKQISQDDLSDIILRRSEIDKLEAEVTALEADVFSRLKEKARVEEGLLTARVKTWERRDPSWKSVVIRELGEAYATRVLVGTKPTPHERLEISLG